LASLFNGNNLYYCWTKSFRNPRCKIIPPYLPNPKAVNTISGVAEIVLGIALMIESLTSLAAWGVIALLIAVPTHVYVSKSKSTRWGY
jgi:uncharacterized membrane protein